LLKYIDLFCGIGGFRFAIEKEARDFDGIVKCVFSSDIDKYAQESYFANFNELPHGDIKLVNAADIPEHNLLFAGFPCQPFSIIGLRGGFEDTRGTLFFDIARILSVKKPHAFILENVKQLVGHNGGKTLQRILDVLKELGYYVEYRVLNALNYGLPQKRERVFIIGSKSELNLDWQMGKTAMRSLDSILEKNIDPKHFVSQHIKNRRASFHTSAHSPGIWHENKSGNITSYPYSCALRANASYNYLLVDGIRRLTPREQLRLQGFPETFKIVGSDAQLRKQTGNAVPVNVAQSVIKMLLNSDDFLNQNFKSVVKLNKQTKRNAQVT